MYNDQRMKIISNIEITIFAINYGLEIMILCCLSRRCTMQYKVHLVSNRLREI